MILQFFRKDDWILESMSPSSALLPLRILLTPLGFPYIVRLPQSLSSLRPFVVAHCHLVRIHTVLVYYLVI